MDKYAHPFGCIHVSGCRVQLPLPRLVATTAVAPFEVLRTLQSLQTPIVSDDIYVGMRTATNLYHQEGMRAFWKGNLVQLAKTLSYQAIQLYTTEFLNWPRVTPSIVSPFLEVIPSSLGVVLATVITYPLEVVHVRFIQQSLKEPKYTGISDALRTISKEEGIRSLYRGIMLDLIGVYPFALLLYWWPTIYGKLFPRVRSNVVQSVILSALLNDLLLPYDNVKNKLLAAKGETLPPSMVMRVEATSLQTALTTTIKMTGITSLWSGVLPSTVNAISFVLVKSLVSEVIERFFLWFNGYTLSPFSKRPKVGVPQDMTPHELKEWYKTHPDL
jgi:solute carrier family 25 protein 43